MRIFPPLFLLRHRLPVTGIVFVRAVIIFRLRNITHWTTMTPSTTSPFLHPGHSSADKHLGIISLKRDLQVATFLRAQSAANPTDGITNTRFGSFPHSTLLNVPWGSQVVASKVEISDARRGRKRKRDGKEEENKDDDEAVTQPAFEVATSGFAHILSPTAELWTLSLPHRTQVVYTPDYSFVLQRLRVRPGDTIIEAGAGSGSFTHAAARAVYSGVEKVANSACVEDPPRKKQIRTGKVCSFEYHEPRHQQLQKEIEDHGLDGVVKVTHRDVYEEGFAFDDGESPNADAVFLDLPAPWTALKHLARTSALPGRPSPLNPNTATRICTFSPCIEQVEQTIITMRDLGWIEITMFEMQHKRLDVRRELTSLKYEGLRGVNATAASVEEAVGRLRELDEKFQIFHQSEAKNMEQVQALKKYTKPVKGSTMETKQSRLDRIKEEDKERKVWREGKLVHRSEPEVKTHTSFLVFAILPRAWSEEDEERMRNKWVVAKGKYEKPIGEGRKVKISRSQPTVQNQTEEVDVLMTEV
jgi:tRNA (adenine57-N1/adenine58-N1)-methyltransferase